MVEDGIRGSGSSGERKVGEGEEYGENLKLRRESLCVDRWEGYR